MPSSNNIHKKVDTLGACLSFACAVHCLIVPFLVAILPLLGLEILVHRSFDLALLTFTATVAGLSFLWGTRVHKNHRVFIWLAIAITLFFAGELAVHGTEHAVLVAIGGAFLGWGHLVNKKLTSNAATCAENCSCESPELSQIGS